MFGSLSDFSDKAYFDAHPYGNLFYGGKNHGLEFFALILTDAYNDQLFTPAVQSDSEKEELLNYIFSKAKYTREIPLSTDDRIVFLSTCTSSITNGRYMLAGKISKKIYPQRTKKVKRVIRKGNGIEKQISRFIVLPVWFWVVLLFILSGLTVMLERRQIKRNHRE